MKYDFHPLANIFPLLEGEEYQALVNDIKTNGLLEPIWLYEGMILDGRNRYRACQDAGVELVCREYKGKAPNTFIISMNLHRRHLEKHEWARILYETVLPEQRKLAAERRAHGKTAPGRTLTDDSSASVGEAIEETAKVGGIGVDTLKKYARIAESSRGHDLKEKVDAGKMPIYRAENELKRRERAANPVDTPALPKGKYNTIIIDPPWPMDKIDRDVAPNQGLIEYPTMSIEAISDLDIASFAADDCHLFLWTTQKYLPHAFDVLKQWGFRYVFAMVWHKNGGFQPYNLPQYNTEFVLYARNGSPEFTTTKNFFTSFTGERREHSRKPVEFYDLIRRVTSAPRIDIFNRETIKDFDSWGNESGKFDE